MRKPLIALALAFGFIGFVAPSASAAAPVIQGRSCVASSSSDVTVDRKANAVTIKDNPITFGNNFGCYVKVPVVVGSVITFNYTGVTCGGGVPRLFIQFADGTSVNTFDNTPCAVGTVSYTLVQAGTITSFAFINDAGVNDAGISGTVTYSNLVIDGKTVNF